EKRKGMITGSQVEQPGTLVNRRSTARPPARTSRHMAARRDPRRVVDACRPRRMDVPALPCDCRQEAVSSPAVGANGEASMTGTRMKPRTRRRTAVERPRLHKVILVNDDYTPREF